MALSSTVSATGTGLTWYKSSYSNDQGGNCIEVAIDASGVVPVRDSKDRTGGTLIFPKDAWADFVSGVRRGKFEPRP